MPGEHTLPEIPVGGRGVSVFLLEGGMAGVRWKIIDKGYLKAACLCILVKGFIIIEIMRGSLIIDLRHWY